MSLEEVASTVCLSTGGPGVKAPFFFRYCPQLDIKDLYLKVGGAGF